MFLHGIGNRKETWDSALAEDAWNRHTRVTTTAPGFGDIPWDGSRLVTYAGSVRQRIIEYNEPTILVGHSVGGIIGTLVAEQAPSNLLGFVNVDGNLTSFDTGFTKPASEAEDIAAWLREFSKDKSPQVQDSLRMCDPAAYQAWAIDTVHYSDDMYRRYAELTIPTLYIYGDTMHPRTVPSIENLAELDNHSTVRFFGASHWVMHDFPGLFSVVVTTWAEQFERALDEDIVGMNAAHDVDLTR
jgi:pimeloyl-ACP methyl ester carboxylesterase